MRLSGIVVSAVFRRRKFVASMLAVLALLAGFAGARARFSENIMSLLPLNDGVLAEHVYAMEKFGSSRSMFFEVSTAEPSEAAFAADFLAGQLIKIDGVESVLNDLLPAGADISELVRVAPALFGEADAKLMSEKLSKEQLESRFESFSRRAASGFSSPLQKEIFLADPIGVLDALFEKISSSEMSVGRGERGNPAKISSRDGRRILLVARASFPSSDTVLSSKIVGEMDAAIGATEREFPGASILRSGAYVVSSDNAAIAGGESMACLSITAVLMLLICMAAFRRWRFVPLALIPSAFGSLAAFALTALVFNSVSAIAVAFAGIAMGVSIDYAVHVLYRLDSLGLPSPEKAAGVADSLQKPVFIAAGTTLAAFLMMCFSGSREFVQLGFFGIVGIAVSALGSIFILPAYGTGGVRLKPRRKIFDTVSRLAVSMPERLGRWTYVLVALITLAGCMCISKVEFDGDISSLGALESGNAVQSNLIKERWKGNISGNMSVVARAENPDKAAEMSRMLCEILRKRGDLEVYGMDGLFLPGKTYRENIERWNSFWGNGRISSLRADIESLSKKFGLKSGIFDEFLKSLSDSRKILPKESLVLKSLFDERVKISPGDCAVLTKITAKRAFNPGEFRDFLRGECPGAYFINPEYLSCRISDLARKWSIGYGIASFAVVALYLLVSFRRIRSAFAVLASVALGLFWSLGLFGALGISVNIVNSIFVVFAVCMAQDYAVFLVSADRSGVLSASAGVFVSALTTCTAFAVLGAASHPVLGSLGRAAAISIFCIMCASFLLARKFAGMETRSRQ